MNTCLQLFKILIIQTYTYIYVTGFAKNDLMGTNTEIHFLSVDESHTQALSKDTKYLRLDGLVCFDRRLFSNAIKP